MGIDLDWCIFLSISILRVKSLKCNSQESKIFYFYRSFMVDKDAKEHSAIETVFPDSQVLYCWFHVIQVNSMFQSHVLITVLARFAPVVAA